MPRSSHDEYLLQPPGRWKSLALFTTLTAVVLVVGWMTNKAAKEHDALVRTQLSALVSSNEPFQKVAVYVNRGDVSLVGSVATAQDKKDLLRKVNETRHVRAVKDEVVVDTPWRPDRLLRKDLYERLQAQQLPQVGLKVKKGTVTVTGEIPTLAQHDQVFVLIATARGVRGVSDQTVVREKSRKQ
jgi:osmotically-inducible protein OsmY